MYNPASAQRLSLLKETRLSKIIDRYVSSRPLYIDWLKIKLCCEPRRSLTRLAAAAAAAKSGFPLALLVAALGRADPLIAAPFEVFFTPTPLCSPFTVECLFGAGLLGELLGTSRFLTAAPFLKLVAGGSGNGLVPTGVWTELKRLMGELLTLLVCVRVRAKGLIPVTNS